MTTVSPPVLPRAPVAPVSPVVPVAPVSPVDPVAPVFPVAPFSACAPVAPVAPVAPAGPGTGAGTVTTVAGGVTTVGLSHALNESAISIAEKTIEYFMRIPFDYLTNTAYPGRLETTRRCNSKVRHIRVRLCTLANKEV